MLRTHRTLSLLIATTCLILIGVLIVYGSVERKKSMRMSNVGGQTNQCTCTERIEH